MEKGALTDSSFNAVLALHSEPSLDLNELLVSLECIFTVLDIRSFRGSMSFKLRHIDFLHMHMFTSFSLHRACVQLAFVHKGTHTNCDQCLPTLYF